ncbi:MAG: hypothetical protein ACOC5T_05215 [Elusimicrobiota bacterium]
MADCKYRKDYWCLKHSIAIPVDNRDPQNPKCWNQKKGNYLNGCADFEPK